jgi:hypothetical protein
MSYNPAPISEGTTPLQRVIDGSRPLVRAYVQRRSPWGPPWWIYGVSYGVLNFIRQVVIITTAAEMSTQARVASWLATALVVIAVVNSVAAILRRRTIRRGVRVARVYEIERSDIGPKEEAA